jgi:uncharacterized protein with von Willebrand factor type A (vWA) domain
MDELSGMFLRELVAIPCPSCGYQVEVQLLDARVQAYRRCPCCHVLIRLVDSGGSMYGELEKVDEAMAELDRALRRFK